MKAELGEENKFAVFRLIFEELRFLLSAFDQLHSTADIHFLKL